MDERKDVLEGLDELRHRAVDAGKQAGHDLWVASQYSASPASMAHAAAKATADTLVQEIVRLREALTRAIDLIDEGLPTSARRFMRDTLAGGDS